MAYRKPGQSAMSVPTIGQKTSHIPTIRTENVLSTRSGGLGSAPPVLGARLCAGGGAGDPSGSVRGVGGGGTAGTVVPVPHVGHDVVAPTLVVLAVVLAVIGMPHARQVNSNMGSVYRVVRTARSCARVAEPAKPKWMQPNLFDDAG
jgi:hypothetical protein